MFAKFFIERPVLANVLALVIMLLGGVALYNLPVAQYPPITPPTIQVTANYPGANAKTLVETVALPDRATGQRRREHALHAVYLHRRRPLYLNYHV